MSDSEKTEPNTIRALAQDLASFERRQEARTELLLNEMRRHGTAIAELAAAFASLHARVEEHDAWERQRAEAPRTGNGEVLE